MIRPTYRTSGPLLFALLLSSCAGMGIPQTSDPYKKLAQANQLYMELDRPLAAERMFQEGMTLFREKGDQQGLALAYKDYAHFLQKPANDKWIPYYEKNGFLEPGVTWANHREKAVEYFAKSRDLYVSEKRFDGATNAEYNRAVTLHHNEDIAGACEGYGKSVEYAHLNLKEHPDAKVNLPEGFDSWDAYITEVKKRANCPTK